MWVMSKILLRGSGKLIIILTMFGILLNLSKLSIKLMVFLTLLLISCWASFLPSASSHYLPQPTSMWLIRPIKLPSFLSLDIPNPELWRFMSTKALSLFWTHALLGCLWATLLLRWWDFRGRYFQICPLMLKSEECLCC